MRTTGQGRGAKTAHRFMIPPPNQTRPLAPGSSNRERAASHPMASRPIPPA
ncbi:hypothetical protein PLANPX_4573 [Lacipirellula parvula]|uniref:Uncharacterized protein n=1 Tax=Lacipirellula parvula TaxID=2650471 RepID=A0A5K7XIZ1_9BACT|nr:hypothetical protein PLANPX_4573 [Lacipirellula parvula]